MISKTLMVRVWTVDRFTTIDCGATIRLIGCADRDYGHPMKAKIKEN